MEVYVHIPFCVRKCGYCDFVSAPAGEQVQGAYMKALRREICLAAEEQRQRSSRQDVFWQDRGRREADADTGPRKAGFWQKGWGERMDGVVTSVFFGGGTPSIVEAGEIEETLACLRKEFAMAEEAEITLEANPGTLTKEKMEVYRRAGVNRLSIGLQSADDGELALLGRIHTFEEFRENYRLARETGFRNISVDLMAALPGQSTESFERSLLAVTGLSPEHISVYSLIIEKGTPFYGKYHRQAAAREAGEEDCSPLPSENVERAMYAMTGRILAACGYGRYEISNYAKHGFACRHNVGYWTGVPYLGFGISAASYLNGRHTGEMPEHGKRFSNTDDMGTYLRPGMSLGQIRQDEEIVTTERAMEEFMFLGLRMTEGVSEKEFAGRFGSEPEAVYGTVLKTMEREGLMERTAPDRHGDAHWRLTARGIDVSNYVLAGFLF